MTQKISKAFSLIELLVSLIIISLLLAAFSPLITKKMKANDVTVGSFGNNSSISNAREITRQDCESLNAIYVPKGVNVSKPLCVMKYNIGDGYYNDDWSGVKKCKADEDCSVLNGNSKEVTKENLQPVCWVGTTGGSGCNDNLGGYDGCKRTVCNWTGANQLCSNIGWRLPTKEELTAFTNDTYSSKQAYENGNKSLMFCGYMMNSSTSPACPFLEGGCSGTFDGHCTQYHIWSSSFKTPSTSNVWYRGLGGEWYDAAYYLSAGYSARCVLDSIEKETKEDEKDCYDFFCESCKNKEHNSCKKCKQGYVLHDGKCYFGTLDGCNSPTYDDTYQVINCASCNTGYTKCNSGSCAKNTSIAKNCPANTIKVGCTCVMQYNIGDGKYTALGEDFSKVKVCTPGVNCEVKNGKDDDTIARDLEAACWDGKLGATAPTNKCNDDYGGYSGCNRTICNWRGGYEMCSNIGWRLPTIDELRAFLSTTYSNATLSASGLMFCDAIGNSSEPAAICYYIQDRCYGTRGAVCYPYVLWSSTFKTPSIAYDRNLYNKIYSIKEHPVGFGHSVRCVKDL